MAFVKKVLKWPIIRHDNVHALKQLSLFLMKCLYAMQSGNTGMSHMNVLNHAPNLQVIFQKLPTYLQNK